MCGSGVSDSCAGVPPYCSIFLVKYDISCGGQSSKASSVACVSGGIVPPGLAMDSANGQHSWPGAIAKRGQSFGRTRNCMEKLLMSWTDERVELLKKLWSDGLSASQIAAELGGITRNAVIGKVHRLGLAGRAKSPSSAAPRPRKARAHPHMLRVSRPVIRGNTALAQAFEYDIEPEPEVVDNIIPI